MVVQCKYTLGLEGGATSGSIFATSLNGGAYGCSGRLVFSSAHRGVEIQEAYFWVRVLLHMVSEAPSNSALVLAIVVLAERRVLPQEIVLHM